MPFHVCEQNIGKADYSSHHYDLIVITRNLLLDCMELLVETNYLRILEICSDQQIEPERQIVRHENIKKIVNVNPYLPVNLV